MRRRGSLRRLATPALPTTNLFGHFIAGVGITESSGRISQWNNQVNSNHATQPTGANQPYVATDYKGRPVVRFLASDSTSFNFADAHTFSARNVSVFMACRLYGTNSQTMFGLLNYSGNSGHLRSLVGDSSNPTTITMVTRNTGIKPRMNPAMFGTVSGTAAAAGYSNYETSTGLALVGADTDCLGATIGRFNASSFATMDVYEMVVYEGAPTTQEISAIRGYFNAEYGLPSSAYTKNIVFEGDSIVAGTGVVQAQSFPLQTLRPQLEDWRMTNVSTSGANTTTLAARGVAIDTQYVSGGSRNVLMVLVGRNDVTIADNSADIYAAMVSYVQSRVTAGWEVWVCTCIATGSSYQPTINALNARIRGTVGAGIVADAGANRVVDFASLPEFSNASNLTYYQPDSTHPTAAGCTVLANTIAAQLLS